MHFCTIVHLNVYSAHQFVRFFTCLPAVFLKPFIDKQNKKNQKKKIRYPAIAPLCVNEWEEEILSKILCIRGSGSARWEISDRGRGILRAERRVSSVRCCEESSRHSKMKNNGRGQHKFCLVGAGGKMRMHRGEIYVYEQEGKYVQNVIF